MLTRIAILSLMLATTAPAAEPTTSRKRQSVVTNYFEINGMHAPCCAVMLKHALTNLSGVVSAKIYFTNKITRIVHAPDKATLRDIRKAFRSEIVDAKLLKKPPIGKLN